jgi:hypothetical protein
MRPRYEHTETHLLHENSFCTHQVSEHWRQLKASEDKLTSTCLYTVYVYISHSHNRKHNFINTVYHNRSSPDYVKKHATDILYPGVLNET